MITYTEARSLVRRVLGRRRLGDPELEAAAWDGLRRAIEKYDPARGPFDAWAKHVMRQYIANQYRTWRLARSRPAGEEDVADAVVDTRPERDSAMARAVLGALAALPARQAEAAMLCLGEGVTNTAASALMGVSPQAVTQLIHRARARLQCTLHEVHHEATS